MLGDLKRFRIQTMTHTPAVHYVQSSNLPTRLICFWITVKKFSYMQRSHPFVLETTIYHYSGSSFCRQILKSLSEWIFYFLFFILRWGILCLSYAASKFCFHWIHKKFNFQIKCYYEKYKKTNCRRRLFKHLSLDPTKS